MGCVAVLAQAPGIGFQRRRQRSAFQSLNRSWVGAVIKEVVEWNFHPTSIPGWRRPRLCRVLSPEEAENTGRGEFTRHSPELGIVQRILSRVPSSEMPQICTPSMAPCLKFRCAKPLEET